MVEASSRSPRGNILLATAKHACRACAVTDGLSAQATDIAGLIGTVMASGAMDLVVVCDRAVDRGAIRTIHTLGRQGLLPRSVLCGVCGNAETARHAWALREYLDAVVTERENLSVDIDRVGRQTFMAAAGHYLMNQVDASATTTRALVDLLVSNRESLTWPVRQVARSLGVGKTTAYDILRQEGVPTIARWQMLFRLLEGCALLQRGASTEDAAYWAQLADGSSLRRALHHHLGTTVPQVRGTGGWRWLVDQWLGVNPKNVF